MDANANVTVKSLAVMEAEMFKREFIDINRELVSKKIKEMFGRYYANCYRRDIDEHLIYIHDETSLRPYCVSISMYPFLLEGTKNLGGTSKAPTNLQSFCGSFVNLVYQIASDFAGAVATVEFLMYFDYFARKQYGDNYLKTNTKEIQQEFQGVVYAMNQPAAARGSQSVFWNISVFDEHYFKALFDEFYFPDGSQPVYESVEKLQRFFMSWFRGERTKELLTFPVLTAAYLVDKTTRKPIDTKFIDMLADEMSKGLSFFHYESDSADSLASCCFAGSQKVLTKSSEGVRLSTIKDVVDGKYNEYRRNFTVFHNGSWVAAKPIKLPARPLYKVTTANNKILMVTDNHLHLTDRGTIPTSELKVGDFLAFNTRPLDTYPEQDRKLTFEQGVFLGAYLGDGSKQLRDNKYASITFSLSAKKLDLLPLFEQALKDWGIDKNIHVHEGEHNVMFVNVYDRDLYNIINEYIDGNYAPEKGLKGVVFTQSISFRRGILYGLYRTDGGNSNRIYSTSPRLIEDMEALCTSLGINTTIYTDERIDHGYIRGEKVHTNYPVHCIRFYTPGNKRSMGDAYKVILNTEYFRVTEIEAVDNEDDYVYCFEMQNEDEPYFTLPNGVMTHNCRLRNELADNTFSYTLGAGGVATGSYQVITLNVNRMGQMSDADWGDGYYALETIIGRIHKYLLAFRELVKGYIDAGLLPTYSAGYINLDKQFGTIGVNGILEAYETASEKAHMVSFKDYLKAVLGTIKVMNKEALQEYGVRFNTECVPAENLGVKNAKWDKEDGLIVPRDCYNSYFYPVEDTSMTILDRLDAHDGEVSRYLDGGAACHLNLEQLPSKEQALRLIELAAEKGVPYWTTNVLCTICKDCGRIDPVTRQSCKYCGSKNIDYGTRVIGYLKPISSFSEGRQKEAAMRSYMKGVDTNA